MQILKDLQNNQDIFIENFYLIAENHLVNGKDKFKDLFKQTVSLYNEFRWFQEKIDQFID